MNSVKMWSAAAMPPLSERRHGRRTPHQRRGHIAPIVASIIARSASARGERAGIEAPTVVVAEAVLFAGFGSGVDEVIVTVSDDDVPTGVFSGTLKGNWNVALAPAGNVAIAQTIGPVPLQVNAGPLV